MITDRWSKGTRPSFLIHSILRSWRVVRYQVVLQSGRAKNHSVVVQSVLLEPNKLKFPLQTQLSRSLGMPDSHHRWHWQASHTRGSQLFRRRSSKLCRWTRPRIVSLIIPSRIHLTPTNNFELMSLRNFDPQAIPFTKLQLPKGSTQRKEPQLAPATATKVCTRPLNGGPKSYAKM